MSRGLYLLPDPDQPGLTETERLAIMVRNSATLTGKCARGATIPPPKVKPVKGAIIRVTSQAAAR